MTRTPERTALRVGATTLSYSDLDARANRLAQALRTRGVGRGQRVGLCVERGADMLAAVLGILKAGAAYVPLDPMFPQERLRFMAEDAELALLVSTSALVDLFDLPRERQLLLDTDAAVLAAQPDQRLTPDTARDARPEDPAYVIYTSGSTGKPKGVVVPHRAVVNFLTSMAHEPGLTADDVLVAVTTLSFDIAVLELHLPLTLGATVVIASREQAVDGRALRALLEQHRATLMQATPVTWRLLLEAGWQAGKNFKALVGGEGLPKDLADQLIANGIELWNMYGPTETTVWSTCARITDTANGITIGTPIANTTVYILDEQNNLCPIGVPGELCIGGDGVTLGYWKRPELTADRFIADPFSTAPGATLYRTGDLARWRNDGTLEHLGRLDFQVKIRGYRIELGEIETAIARHPAVREAVVVAREDIPGDPRLVAYLVAKNPPADLVEQLRAQLRTALPEYMVPALFVTLDALPLTPNAKIDRKALPAPKRSRPNLARDYIAPRTAAEKQLAALWCELLQLDQIGIDDSFFDLGGTSLAVIRMASLYHSRYGREISPVKVFQYPTIAKLCWALEDNDADSSFLNDAQRRVEQQRGRDSTRDPSRDAVAIVGMVGRFPGADDLEQLWRNLCNNVESISFFTPEELGPGIDEHLRNDPDYVRARGMINGADLFDAAFFGISALEAKVMDPQQRVFLELAQHALENAGYDPDRYKGLIGVFAGIGDNHYYTTNLLTHPDLMAMAGKLAVEAGNQKDYIALRTAYLLDLRGPAVSLNTACSTTLLAVDQACRALLDFECDMALAGGIDITVPQKSGFLYQEGGTFAKDGHCRPFDADATGTMFCDGAGIVVLKRLQDALADGDSIYAVVLGSGKNNNGARPASFLAPSMEGQADAIAMAQARADVPVETIRYIEAHGTGTPVGDPIEFEALCKVFQSKTDKKQFCHVGSIKGNIGHPTNAAGVAGLIKAAMVLHNEQIPATLHFKKPNPKIDFQNSPFVIADRLISFPRSKEPRRAAVSSFGFGGTNVHTILEEAPLQQPGSATRPVQLLLLSARTTAALDTYAGSLAADLENAPEAQLADAAFTLQKGRMQMVQRRFVVAEDTKEAVQLLQQPNPLRCGSKRCERRDPPVVFMFGGQGTQYVNMGHNLYQDEPLFRAVVDDCCDLLKPFLGRDLRDFLYPHAGDEETARISLQDTFYTQPSIFVIEYAIARFWLSLGVRPAMMVGHSIGEFVAATLAGVWELEDALRIIALRGKLMQELPRGSMLAVNNRAEIVEKALPPSVQLASINGPSLCVVAGPEADIAALKETLEKQNIVCRHLHTSHAFHSAMMDPMIEPLRAAVARVKLRAPTQPFVSTVTGNLITAEEATDPGYWAHHARATVQFSKAVGWLVEHQYDLFLECGPRSTLSTLVRQHFTPDRSGTAIPTFTDTHENNAEWTAMLFALGSLWQNGLTIDWDAFYAHEDRRRIPLPTYPFERKRFWVDPAAVGAAAVSLPLQATSLRAESITVELPAATAVSSQLVAQTGSPDSRKDRITASLVAILITVSGREHSQISTSATFLEQGFDSLSLTQVAFAFHKEFGIKVTFGQLMNLLPNIDMVAAHFDKTLAPDLFSDRPSVEPIAAIVPIASTVPATETRAGTVRLPDAVQADETLVTLPTTAGQREIWFAAQLGDNESRAYSQLVSIRFHGNLHPGMLQASLQYLVDRHDSLRVTILANGEQQFIHPKRPQELPLVDLSAMETQEQESRFQALADQHSGTLFDLVNGPLMKAHLIRLNDDDHVLHLVLHHVVIDGWSTHLVALELGRIYSAKAGGIGGDPLPTMQYRDYVKWYYDPETISSRHEAEEYWLKSFSDLPASVELPSDRPRPLQRSYRAGNANITIDRELYGRLKQFSAKSNCTIFHFLLATFMAWLHRVTKQDDVVVGVPFAGQLASNLQYIAGCERLVGHCSNVVPIRSEVQGTATIADFLGDVKRKVFDAKVHEGVTYGELVEKLNPPRNPGRLPFVSVTLNLNDEPDIHWHQLNAAMEYPPRAYVFRELEINVWESPNGLRIACYYADELFDYETVNGWLYQWKTLMESAADTPAEQVDQLNLVGKAERDRLSIDLNKTTRDYPRNALMQELFEAQVTRTPERTALRVGATTLSYSDLDARANRLAQALRTRGVGRGQRVGLCVERGADMLAAVLGILKAGAAYVPLDPMFPQERLRFMAEDAELALLVSTSALVDLFDLPRERQLLLDTDAAVLAAQPDQRLTPDTARDARPEDPAYVIYTSGSTGKPKGVVVPHRAVVNFLTSMAHEPGLTADDVLVAVTTLSFDIAVLELHLPLTLGATVVIASREQAVDGRALRALLEQHRATLMQATPVTWRLLLEAGWQAGKNFKALVGGEGLPKDLADQLIANGIELWNMYGPTETTVWSTCARITDTANGITIGTPIANTTVYILDEQNNLCPIGVPGELCIGGDGVTLGYWKRPELTADRFIADPFSTAPGATLYRTGDLARWRNDGTLEHLGRLDFQVKIRGYRIELGEIETAIARHPAVREAVVVAREDIPGDPRLVAYLVAKNPPADLVEQLRAQLRTALPEYMVPALFVTLDALPLTPNAKIDRKALPIPDSSQSHITQRTVLTQPRTETERILAGIWAEVLGLEQVGIEDNFFDLGGHSLLAMRMVSRVREEFSFELPMRELFAAPTIADLSLRMEAPRARGASVLPKERIEL